MYFRGTASLKWCVCRKFLHGQFQSCWCSGSLSRHDISIFMMTSSNGNIFRVTGHLCGEFTGPRWIPHTKPVTRSFDVFFDLRLNKRLSKQWWGWWFETLSLPLWRHRNVWGYFSQNIPVSTPLGFNFKFQCFSRWVLRAGSNAMVSENMSTYKQNCARL